MKTMTRVAAFATATALVLGGSPSSASEHSLETPGSQHTEDVPDISLVVFSTASYTEIFNEVVKQNGPKNAVAFFDAAGRHLPEGFPVVSDLAENHQQAIYVASAEAALAGAPLPPAVATLANPHDFEIAPMAWSTYPVRGNRINNNRSWRNNLSLSHIVCNAVVFCTERGRVDIRMTTDPGVRGTRTGINQTSIGNTRPIGNITYRGTVYRSSNPIHTNQIWLTHPGSGTLFNSQHGTLLNSNFEMGYRVTAQIGGSSSSVNYKTGRGDCYTSTASRIICWFH